MGFMRRLRLSRSDAEGSAAAEEMGLDAFGTETMGAPAPAETAGVSQQSRIAIAILASLVLIEAVPTALWIRAVSVPDGGRAGAGGGVARPLSFRCVVRTGSPCAGRSWDSCRDNGDHWTRRQDVRCGRCET